MKFFTWPFFAYLSAVISLLLPFKLQASNHDTQKMELTLGVFSYLGEERTQEKFQPIVDYLNRYLKGEHISLRVMPQEELYQEIEAGRVDIVMTNPTHFLVSRQQNLLSGVIATLVQSNQGQPIYQLAGAIIAHADRDDLVDLNSLRLQTIAIPSFKNMGGYRAQAYELYRANINRNHQINFIELLSHQAVVQAVVAGEVDVGFVRDGIIEQMIAEQKINEQDIKVINPQNIDSFPHRISTRLYPEWPVFALKHVDERAVRHIASALFALEPDDPAATAADIYGFTIPADYLVVEELARSLRLPPFDKAPDFTFADTWERWNLIYSILLFTLAMIVVLILIVIRALRREHLEHERFELLLSALGEGVYGTDQHGKCIFVNPAALKTLGIEHEDHILGKNQHDLFHHHRPSGEAYPISECPIHLTSQDGRTRRQEEWFFRANGEGFPVDMVSSPLYQNGALVGSVVVFQDITERQRLKKQLMAQATTDQLTGLYNRRQLFELLHKEFARIKRSNQAAALIMADLDHFKHINDAYGHATGDEVLKIFAQLMQETMRGTDVIGRIGGEEFVVLLPETSPQQALVAAERLRTIVEDYCLKLDDQRIKFTVSLGLAQLDGQAESVDEVLAKADRALYQAKHQGRNQTQVADQDS